MGRQTTGRTSADGGNDEWEPKLVCPRCHGDVKDVLLQSIGSDGKRMHRFDRRKCGRGSKTAPKPAFKGLPRYAKSKGRWNRDA